MERATLFARRGPVRPSRLLESSNAPGLTREHRPAERDTPELLSLAQVERAHIFRVLGQCDQNLTRASHVLGVALSTLKRKLKEYRSDST